MIIWKRSRHLPLLLQGLDTSPGPFVTHSLVDRIPDHVQLRVDKRQEGKKDKQVWSRLRLSTQNHSGSPTDPVFPTPSPLHPDGQRRPLNVIDGTGSLTWDRRALLNHTVSTSTFNVYLRGHYLDLKDKINQVSGTPPRFC